MAAQGVGVVLAQRDAAAGEELLIEFAPAAGWFSAASSVVTDTVEQERDLDGEVLVRVGMA